VTADPPLSIKFSARTDGVRVDLAGTSSFDNTVAYWLAIVDHIQAKPPKSLLLVDRLRGEPLSADQWKQLVESLRNLGLERVRIAHVKPDGLEQIEYCQLYALEAGFSARVFEDEAQADLWLRHAAF